MNNRHVAHQQLAAQLKEEDGTGFNAACLLCVPRPPPLRSLRAHVHVHLRSRTFIFALSCPVLAAKFSVWFFLKLCDHGCYVHLCVFKAKIAVMQVQRKHQQSKSQQNSSIYN